MADGKDLLVRIDATTTGYERALARAEAQTHSFEYALRRANAEAAQNAKNLAAQTHATEQLGRGMFVAGGVIAAGLALAAKAAIDWESQWTSVLKVLDGTPEQLAAVEQGIRDLSLELPTSHEELAKIAASAGALGISTPNIVEFTKTIAELGETTNLVGDEGATTLARFANVMGTSQGEIDNVASSLVALGNSGASTEAEIAALGLRLAAAGRNAGLSEGEVLGLANAMSSLGIEAESGGTAVSMTFQMIDKAVKTGGASVKGFADVAGLSVDKFVQLYGEDAAGALTKFLDGLGRIKDSGGNVYQVLNDLGITGQRQIDTLTRLAGAGDLVTESLKVGAREYERNMALTDEFAKRNETTAAELERARNAAVDFAIDLGETLLPAIGAVAENLSGMLQFLGDLPDPVKEIGVIFTAAAAAVLLVGGAAIYTKVKLVQLRARMASLNATGEGMSRRMIATRAAALGLGAALAVVASQSGDSNKELQAFATVASGAALGFAAGGPWGAAIGGAIGVLTAFGQANAAAAAEVQSVADSLDEQTGAVTRNTYEWASSKLIDAGIPEIAEKFGLSIGTLTKAALGNADAMSQVDAATTAAFESFQKLQDENPNQAIRPSDYDVGDAQAIKEEIEAINGVLQDSREEWRLQQEVAQAAGEESVAALDGTKVSAYDAQVGVEALTAAFQDLNDELTKRSSARDYAAAVRDATAALKENGKTLNINTDAGSANSAALDKIASTALAHAEAVVKDTNSVEAGRKVLQGARQDLLAQAQAFGMSDERARHYVDSVLSIPHEWKTKTELDTSGAKIAAGALAAYIEALDPVMNVGLAIGQAAATLSHKADGGLILGPGGPKDDKAGYYALSNREFVQPNEAVEYYGVGFMEAIRQRAIPRGRMADGGTPGGGPPGQSLFTLARLMHLLARPEELTSIKDVNDLIQVRNREERELSQVLREQAAARKAVQAANEAERGVHGEKNQAEAARATAQAEKALSKVEKEVTDQRSQLADATDKWKTAQAELLEQAKTFALTVSSLGDAFGGEGTSTTAQGLIAKKLAAGKAGREFEMYLRVMRRKNLDADLIAEIRAEGPTSEGLALAESIAESGRRQIRQLNAADDRLDRAARSVGTFGIGGQRHHGGRGRDGPLVNVEKIIAHDPKLAAKELEKRQRKALTIAKLG